MLLSGSGQWCPVGLPFKDGVAKANDAHGAGREANAMVFWQWLNLLRLIIIAVMVLVSCLMLSSS